MGCLHLEFMCSGAPFNSGKRIIFYAMRYLRAQFEITGTESESLLSLSRDVLVSLASDAGFESFAEEDGHLAGYIQEDLFDADLLASQLEAFPIEGVSVSYTLEKAEDKDWNALWEEEGFPPIVIDDLCVVHDLKHDVPPGILYKVEVLIDARMAFGTGNHATTRLMLSTLLREELSGLRVLDCGCGTGILSIAASKAGASEVVAYDIDEWSVENTAHNAELNGVSNIEVLVGNVSVLSHVSGLFDVVLANINRNVLLADMGAMREVLSSKGKMILSGFYDEDVELIVAEAQRIGLTLQSRLSEDNWSILSFSS